ncbi:trichohyalin-like [Paramacrobiotus metropolitanus]|uniref:trichohyalin-like n=1 Tax=Paramacrobiotus metropolitanus TaxID=2943436 RepID=UPI0024457610|nr:trichohyalin-like [Paramacrobiotus metropolitanus]
MNLLTEYSVNTATTYGFYYLDYTIMSTHEPKAERQGEVRAEAQSGERTDAGIHLGAEKYMKEDNPQDNPAYDEATGRQTGAGVPPSQREMGDRQREAGAKGAAQPDEYVKAAVVPAPAPSADHLMKNYPGMYPEVEEQERRRVEGQRGEEAERERRHHEHHHHRHHHHHHRDEEPRHAEKTVEVRGSDGEVQRAKQEVMGDSWQGPDPRNPEESRRRDVQERDEAPRERRVARDEHVTVEGAPREREVREEVATRDRDVEPRRQDVREEKVRNTGEGERREVREKVKDTDSGERREVREEKFKDDGQRREVKEKRVSDDGERREEHHVEKNTENPRKGYKMSEAYAHGEAVHMDAQEDCRISEKTDDEGKEVHREETTKDDGERRTETKKEVVRDRDSSRRESEGNAERDRRQGHVEEDVVSRPPNKQTEGGDKRVDIGGESQGEMHERTDVKMPEYNEQEEMAAAAAKRAAEDGAAVDKDKVIAEHAAMFPDDEDEHKKGGLVHKLKHALHLDRSERKAEKERKKEAEEGFPERQEKIKQTQLESQKAMEVTTEEKVETPDGEKVRGEKVTKERDTDGGSVQKRTTEIKEEKDPREPADTESVREDRTVETRDSGASRRPNASGDKARERNTETREKITDDRGDVREERRVERNERRDDAGDISRREEKTVKVREPSPSRGVTSQGVQTGEPAKDQPPPQGSRDQAYEGGAVSNSRQNATVPLEILNPEGMHRKAEEDEIIKSGQNYAEMDFRQPHEERIPRDRIERMVEMDHKRKAAGLAPDAEVLANNFQVTFHTADSMERVDQAGQPAVEQAPPRRDSSYRR